MAARYHLMLRPPGYAQMPDGHTAFEGGLPKKDWPTNIYAPILTSSQAYGHLEATVHCFGWVEYPEPLPMETVWKWDLRPDNRVEFAHFAFYLYADRDLSLAEVMEEDYLNAYRENVGRALNDWRCPVELQVPLLILARERGREA